MWKFKNVLWFAIFFTLFIPLFLQPEENTHKKESNIEFLAYRFLPINKPQFDYLSTLRADSKSLGLKRSRELRKLLRQSNNFWAIRAVQRHILEEQDYAFKTTQSFVRKGYFRGTRAKINLSLSPGYLENLIEKRTAFSIGGLIKSNLTWNLTSYFLQSRLDDISLWKTVGVFKFNKDSHSFKVNLGIEENSIFYLRYGENERNRVLIGSLKFSDIWRVTPDLTLACEIKYDYLKWVKTFNLISPNLKLSVNLSETIRLNSGFSYDLSAPGGMDFIRDEVFSLGHFYIVEKIEPERAFKWYFGMEKNLGKSSININAHYERIENQIFPLPVIRRKKTDQPEFIYFIYNIKEVEDKGLNITFSRDIGSLIHGSISYGLIFSQAFNEEGKLITEPQILSSNLLENKVVHIISSIIEARIPITNTVIFANYNWASDNLYYRSYSLNRLRSRIRIKQDLPFLNFYGKVKIMLDLINFLENNDLLNENECIILLPYSRKIIGGIEIKF
ncbi:TonB-dependent receptor [Candidatus Aminicenantes bacterium AC-335-B20]|jgi:hypothetical protein|nr:TonB-dependent receptor [SCandidatus Aminicenantes bacterium Aminicenantia_JdfR_composite]MCP2598887.1 TonB-dependent receptor [Candidatus Aminicenantes bacterium AC-335-B20]